MTDQLFAPIQGRRKRIVAKKADNPAPVMPARGGCVAFPVMNSRLVDADYNRHFPLGQSEVQSPLADVIP